MCSPYYHRPSCCCWELCCLALVRQRDSGTTRSMVVERYALLPFHPLFFFPSSPFLSPCFCLFLVALARQHALGTTRSMVVERYALLPSPCCDCYYHMLLWFLLSLCCSCCCFMNRWARCVPSTRLEEYKGWTWAGLTAYICIPHATTCRKSSPEDKEFCHKTFKTQPQACCVKILSALLYSQSSIIYNALWFSYIPRVLRWQICHVATKIQSFKRPHCHVDDLSYASSYHLDLFLFPDVLLAYACTYVSWNRRCEKHQIYFRKHKILRQLYFLTGNNCLIWVITVNPSAWVTAKPHTTLVTSGLPA